GVPGRVRIGPGADVVRDVAPRVAEGTLRVVDRATGMPLVRGAFSVVAEGRTSRRVMLDEHGEARLELLPGDYVLDFELEARRQRHELVWTATGPMPSTIVVER